MFLLLCQFWALELRSATPENVVSSPHKYECASLLILRKESFLEPGSMDCVNLRLKAVRLPMPRFIDSSPVDVPGPVGDSHPTLARLNQGAATAGAQREVDESNQSLHNLSVNQQHI